MPWDTEFVNPFATILPPPSAASGLRGWLRADTGIVFGGTVTPVVTGTAPPGVTFTGVPTADVQSIEVDCTTSGATELVAQFVVKVNGAVVFGPAVGAATLGPFHGVTVHLPVDPYTNDNVWTTVPSVASWTASDGTVWAQAAQANQPMWIAPGLVLAGFAAGLGGQATVRFDGANYYMTNATFVLAQPFSWYAVVKSPNPGHSSTLWCTPDANVYVVNGSEPYWYATSSAGAGFILHETASGLYQGGMLSWIANGANSQFPIAHMAASNGAFGIVAGFVLGAYENITLLWQGDLSEMFFYSHAVTPSEDAAVRVYCCNRYGLS